MQANRTPKQLTVRCHGVFSHRECPQRSEDSKGPSAQWHQFYSFRRSRGPHTLTEGMRRHGARLTEPSLVDTIVAFLIGNLFANFLLLLAALVVLARALHLEVALGLAVAAYAARIWTSRAQFTGEARWPALARSLFCSSPFDYFGMELICDEKVQLPAGEKFVFACAPHGIHGFGLGMLTYEGDSSPFYRRFPQLRGQLVGLVASVLFRVPLVRELFLYMGCESSDGGRSAGESPPSLAGLLFRRRRRGAQHGPEHPEAARPLAVPADRRGGREPRERARHGPRRASGAWPPRLCAARSRGGGGERRAWGGSSGATRHACVGQPAVHPPRSASCQYTPSTTQTRTTRTRASSPPSASGSRRRTASVCRSSRAAGARPSRSTSSWLSPSESQVGSTEPFKGFRQPRSSERAPSTAAAAPLARSPVSGRADPRQRRPAPPGRRRALPRGLHRCAPGAV